MKNMPLGEFTVTLSTPIGVALEECDAGKSGVQVASVTEGGNVVGKLLL